MSYKTLEVETRDRVAYVWMNRPELHNAFDETVIGELTSVFEKLDTDNKIRVVVLGGRGKSFSAGADLNWIKRAARHTTVENLRDARQLAKMLHTIHALSKPAVARIHGATFAGGTGLTAACDIAVASTQAQFATTEVRLGLIPATISPYVIAAIGSRAARRYFLTGERFDANEAKRIGLVHEVCAPEELDKKVDSIVSLLLEGGPHAMAAAKTLVTHINDHPLTDELIEDTSTRIANIRATEEAREGVEAFLTKRKPNWVS